MWLCLCHYHVGYLGHAWWVPYRPTTDRRVGWRITKDSLRRPLEQRGRTPPYLPRLWRNYVTIVSLPVRVGLRAHLRLIRDRFIAGHSSCELRRHLVSVPPETPICDVVDRCRFWESHADPAVRRVGKPSPDTGPTIAGRGRRGLPLVNDPSDEIGTVWCVSHVGSRVMLRLDVRTWTNIFHLCSRDGGRRRLR